MAAIHAPVNVYITVIVIKCCQMSCTSEAFAIVAYGFKHVMYNTMIKGLCKFGNNDTPIALLRLMNERGCKHDVMTHNTVIDSLCKEKMVDDALKLFNEMILHKGILPCKNAHELFNDMQVHNQIPPDACTYKIVLEGLCNNHQVDEALYLFCLMGENKLDLDIVVYNILIDGASKCGKPDIAKALFCDLSVQGLHCNVWTYNVMVNGFCREGLVREAKELFLKMEERGCPPDCVTYNVLLQGLLKNGQHDTIEMLLEKMDEQSFMVDASTLSVLLDHISSRSLNVSVLKLIGKLVLNEGKEAPCIKSI
ncbi:Pentatricopeptide repeat-containing protein [Cynara cardunculus var. scolymus]|uniref:Pentatricopeptide repeat-containing protein n=1 Tax=Cynara cardunculus var. scolymus TaxID=59895 RepID=A0A103XIC2_CYNCS|nr:Pentatricopeptide repeat-containing protein [Cynara cardunculus var. scolymus]